MTTVAGPVIIEICGQGPVTAPPPRHGSTALNERLTDQTIIDLVEWFQMLCSERRAVLSCV